ncbi:MAG: acyl-CoA thioesterase [Clostridiales bacterium GWF2_38_85]|nr:MAG: acyl-CoA thioesterase [Clostridiales bacterium GWF2_38_85]HBL84781.1 acyl-CoA thioesterase [Clostridiales bacterium]
MDNIKPASKHVSESRTEHVEIVLLEHLNGFNRLFGGKLVEWIDIVAAVVARRHSNRNVTTASIDNLQFKEPAYINNTIVLQGRITYVGKTSMEVRIDTFVEKLNGDKRLINRAYLVLVALDENENPVPVPGLILETDEDKDEWQSGIRRHDLRKQRRIDNY